MLKRFLVFAGDDYYPDAGMGDFKEDVDTIEEAKHCAHCLKNENVGPGDWARAKYDWVHIYDSELRLTLRNKHG